MFKYAIVEFEGPEPREVEIIHITWLKVNQAYWPSFCESRDEIDKLLKREVCPGEDGWTLHNITRILSTTDDFATAKRKCAYAEDTSDLNTDLDVSRHIKKRKRLISENEDSEKDVFADSSECEEDSVSLVIPCPKSLFGNSKNSESSKVVPPESLELNTEECGALAKNIPKFVTKVPKKDGVSFSQKGHPKKKFQNIANLCSSQKVLPSSRNQLQHSTPVALSKSQNSNSSFHLNCSPVSLTKSQNNDRSSQLNSPVSFTKPQNNNRSSQLNSPVSFSNLQSSNRSLHLNTISRFQPQANSSFLNTENVNPLTSSVNRHSLNNASSCESSPLHPISDSHTNIGLHEQLLKLKADMEAIKTNLSCIGIVCCFNLSLMLLIVLIVIPANFKGLCIIYFIN